MFDFTGRINSLLWPTTVIVVGFIGGRWVFSFRGGRRVAWIGFSFLLFTFTFARALGSPFHPVFNSPSGLEIDWAKALEAVWWLSAAWLVVAFLRLRVKFENRPRESRLVTDLLAGTVYIGGLLAITANVFGLPINGLLATSGVVAIVLGLALQSTLSDVFSGLSLDLERPYSVGDFIEMEGNIEGQVVEMNWRATHIRMPSNDVAVIPNSVLAKSCIVNRSLPEATHAETQKVTLDSWTTPERGIEIILRATLACPDVLQLPQPEVECVALRSDCIDYEVTFSVTTINLVSHARTQLLTEIRRHTTWASIGISAFLSAVSPASLSGPLLRPVAAPSTKTLIEHSGLFNSLRAEELEKITAKLRRHDIAERQSIVVKGQQSGSLFFVMAGVLDVRRPDESGAEESVGRLGPGDFFGEFALVNGKPEWVTIAALTNSVVFELAKEDASAVASQPAVMKQLKLSVARREAVLSSRDEANHGDRDRGPTAPTFKRLWAFLRGSSSDG